MKPTRVRGTEVGLIAVTAMRTHVYYVESRVELRGTYSALHGDPATVADRVNPLQASC